MEGALKSVSLADMKEQHEELARLRTARERVRIDLFEACCEFQRDCNAVTLERLSVLTASLKILERRCAEQHDALAQSLASAKR